MQLFLGLPERGRRRCCRSSSSCGSCRARCRWRRSASTSPCRATWRGSACVYAVVGTRPCQPGRPPADPAQLPEAALRGEFPLLAGAGARERRGHRALSRRAARGRCAERALRRCLRQRLEGSVHAGTACLLPGRLRPARHHLSLCRDGAALLRRRHHLRRHDADRFGLRPGAVRAVVLRRQLHLRSPSCAPSWTASRACRRRPTTSRQTAIDVVPQAGVADSRRRRPDARAADRPAAAARMRGLDAAARAARR